MKNCSNCKYAEPMNNALGCLAQKGMPCVEADDSCERWATTKRTNADMLRAMSDEEIEAWYWQMHEQMMWYTDSHLFVHEWLKQET